MELLKSLSEYTGLIREVKRECKRPFSNIYFMPAQIERYIKLGRAKYEKNDGSIIFYFDEESCYRACMCADSNMNFVISPKDKKILVRNAYKQNYKAHDLLRIEKKLEEMGFHKDGTMVQIQASVEDIIKSRSAQSKKYAEKLRNKGYYCAAADESNFCEAEEIITSSGMVRDYHLDYKTTDEKKDISQCSYLCVFDKDGEMCAVSILDIRNGVGEGQAVAVKEKYKMRGVMCLMSEIRTKWFLDNNLEILRAWIKTDNEDSIRYHKSIGYHLLDKYTDEWILDML